MSSAPEKTKGRILVVRGGAIGEFVLTVPVFSALREHFPETRLEILGYARTAQIAKDAGLVDDYRSIETRAAACFFARNAKLDEDLSSYFAQFSLIFSYLYDPDRFFETNIAKVSKAQFIAAPSKPDEKESLHAAESYLRVLERLAIFESDPIPRLPFAAAQDNNWIAVHPAVGNPLRHWPEARWKNLLANILSQSSAKLLLVGGEAERAVLERLANALPPNRAEVLRNAPLSTLAARLASSQAFIGHDSGITHLAAAVGIPCTVLWGAGNQTVWKPLSDRKLDLLHRPKGLATLTEEDVLATLPLHRVFAE